MAFHRLTYLALVGLVPTLVLSEVTTTTQPTTITHPLCPHTTAPVLLADKDLSSCDDITTIAINKDTTTAAINTALFTRVPKNANLLIVNNDVSIIPDYAFHIRFPDDHTSNLKTVEFEPRSILTTIGRYAFSNAESLSQILIPYSVTHIGYAAFIGCVSLSEINLPTALTAISDYTFRNSGLLRVSIPQGVTSIGEFAFTDSTHLARVIFDGASNLETINRNAFSGCTELNYVILPNETTLGRSAFEDTNSLDMIKIPTGVNLDADNIFFNSKCNDGTASLYQPGNTLIDCKLTSEAFEESEDDSDDVPTWSIIVISVLGGIIFLMAVGFVLMRRHAIYKQLTTRAEF